MERKYIHKWVSQSLFTWLMRWLFNKVFHSISSSKHGLTIWLSCNAIFGQGWLIWERDHFELHWNQDKMFPYILIHELWKPLQLTKLSGQGMGNCYCPDERNAEKSQVWLISPVISSYKFKFQLNWRILRFNENERKFVIILVSFFFQFFFFCSPSGKQGTKTATLLKCINY